MKRFLALLFFSPMCCLAQPALGEILAKVRALKQECSSIEVMLAEMIAKTSDQEGFPSGRIGRNPGEQKGDRGASDTLNLNVPGARGDERSRLKDIENALLDNPLGHDQRKILKNFILQVKDKSLKSEALFFLGEVYYLRQKLSQGKPKDIQKALRYFSRSYSLDPKNSRTPKALVRVAQCLTQEKKFAEAQSILDKVKFDYAQHLGVDLQKEYDKVTVECQKCQK